MSKTILILSASPRKKGNSDLLCEQFMNGALAAGHNAEKVFLSDKQIGYCSACESCMRNDGRCVINDDAAEIIEKMIRTDVIVLATPVYFYSMNAQLKALIDRTVAKYQQISNKEFYFIVTAAVNEESEMEGTLLGLRGFTRCLPNPTEKGVVFGLGAWHRGDILGQPAMDNAYEMGNKA